MRYHVDSEAVIGATGAVQATVERIRAETGGLHAQLTALQESWGGQAATAFQGVAAEWHATQQRVEEALAAISQALSQAGQRYAEIEAANARLFA